MALPSGYRERAAALSDLPALARLLADCDAAESEPGYGALAGQVRAVVEEHGPRGAGEAMAIVDTAGELVAVASFNLPDYPRPIAFARLHGAVHPSHRRRGIGRYLLEWSERRAETLFDARGEVRPRSLRVTFSGAREDAERLYGRSGFAFHDRSLLLRRDLSARVPERMPPPGISTVAWSPQTAPFFYVAFKAARTQRPEERPLDQAEWCADVASDTTLRPDLSLVALDEPAGDRPCALILAEVVPREGRNVGWIWQLAVAPSHRRRGVGTSLMTQALSAFRREGLPEAGLWVDGANAPARTLYERLGFRPRSQQTTYAREL